MKCQFALGSAVFVSFIAHEANQHASRGHQIGPRTLVEPCRYFHFHFHCRFRCSHRVDTSSFRSHTLPGLANGLTAPRRRDNTAVPARQRCARADSLPASRWCGLSPWLQQRCTASLQRLAASSLASQQISSSGARIHSN